MCDTIPEAFLYQGRQENQQRNSSKSDMRTRDPCNCIRKSFPTRKKLWYVMLKTLYLNILRKGLWFLYTALVMLATENMRTTNTV